MKRLIRKILREEIEKSDRHYRRIDIISEHVHLPYFKSMVGLTIYDKDDQEYIMKKIFGVDIRIEPHGIFYYGDRIYWENSIGDWKKWEYDDRGNKIYYGNSDGDWAKYKYDDRGKMIYREYSDGYWGKYEYDGNDNLIYSESSSGFWKKMGYDDRGREIYYEDSNGMIRDRR